MSFSILEIYVDEILMDNSDEGDITVTKSYLHMHFCGS